MQAAAMVDVTGTNYQCQIIILKKKVDAGSRPNTDKSRDTKQNAWHVAVVHKKIRIKDEDKTIIDQLVKSHLNASFLMFNCLEAGYQLLFK